MRVVYERIIPKIEEAVRDAKTRGLLIQRVELSPDEFDCLVRELHPTVNFHGGSSFRDTFYKVNTPTREAFVGNVLVVEVK